MRLALFLFTAACAFGQQLPNGLYAVFNTSMGNFTARLYDKDVPNTVANFVGLAQGTRATRDPKTGQWIKVALYNNITFHRVTPDVMIQAGDPTGTGMHNCGFTIRDEILPGLRFDSGGKLAMANTGNPDSAGCQFFVTTNANHQWDGKYAVFGMIVQGLDVVNKINHAPVHEEKPLNPVKLISVTIERIGPEPAMKHKK